MAAADIWRMYCITTQYTQIWQCNTWGSDKGWMRLQLYCCTAVLQLYWCNFLIFIRCKITTSNENAAQCKTQLQSRRLMWGCNNGANILISSSPPVSDRQACNFTMIARQHEEVSIVVVIVYFDITIVKDHPQHRGYEHQHHDQQEHWHHHCLR